MNLQSASVSFRLLTQSRPRVSKVAIPVRMQDTAYTVDFRDGGSMKLYIPSGEVPAG